MSSHGMGRVYRTRRRRHLVMMVGRMSSEVDPIGWTGTGVT